MALGQRYQARVTAWWAARLLLQTPVGEIFDIPATTIAERISAETRDQINDLRVNLSNDYLLFGQCKTSINLSSKVTSKWASVLKQFYCELQQDVAADVRRLFVIYYEKNNENLEKLSSLLNNYRDLDKGSNLLDAAFNQAEISIVNDLESLLDQLQQQAGFEKLKACREELVRHIYIEQLELKESSPARLQVIESLQNYLICDPAQLFEVLTPLHVLADDLLAERGSKNRTAIRRMIAGRGVRLKDSLNYRQDFERLERVSQTQLDSHFEDNRHRLVIGEKEAIIDRPVVSAIVDSVKTDSFFIVGDAGVGKTGCILSAIKKLQNEGYRIWYWAADSLAYNSIQEIRNTLNLQYDWKDLFEEASSAGQTILIIDGLDGLRDSSSQKAYRELIRQAQRSGIKVIASIRTFDLHYSPDLKDIFVSYQPLNRDFYNPEFSRVKHLYIKELIVPEIKQAFEKLPELVEILINSQQLLPIVMNLFSLDLLCKLIGDGEDSKVFSAIRTQAELFERFWERRIDSNNLNFELTDKLTDLIEQMIDSQTLQVATKRGFLSGAVKDALFSGGLLRVPSQIPGRVRNENLMEFTHHLLFDYVAEKLYIRPRQASLTHEFAPLDSCAFFIRPSLRLFFLYLWQNGRIDFWEMLVSLQRGGWTTFQKLPATLIVSREASSREDLQPLIDGALIGYEEQDIWRRILQEIISGAAYSEVPNLFSRNSGEWWLEFARDLIKSSVPQLVFGGAQLLDIGFKSFSNLPSASKYLLHESAVLLLHFHIDNEFTLHQNMKLAVKWVCQTFDIDKDRSRTVIRRLLTVRELQRSGHLTAVEIAEELENVSDPIFVSEIYAAIFGYSENDQSLVSISNHSLIDNFTASRSQEYGRSWWTLAHKFPKFLRDNPLQATQALIRIYNDQQNDPQPLTDEFSWDGRKCSILRPHEDSWLSLSGIDDDRKNLLASWQRFIENLPVGDVDSEKIWNEISNILVTENYAPKIWKALLESGAQAPQVLAARLWTILKNKNILLGSETYRSAERCLKAFPDYLSDEQVREIEEIILGFDAQDFPYYDPETVENYLVRDKGELLSLISENKRGGKVGEFLAIHEGEINYSFHGRSDYFPDNFDDSKTSEYQNLNPELTELLKSLAELPITQENLPELLIQIRRMQEIKDKVQNDLTEETRDNLRRKIVHHFKEIIESEIQLDETVISQSYEVFYQELISFQSVQNEQELTSSDNYFLENSNAYLEAAKGYIQLTLKEDELSQESKDMLRLLSSDPIPSVRWNLGSYMWMLLDKWEEFVWETLEKWISELMTQSETQEVLNVTLRDRWFWWLWHRNEERAGKLLKNLMRAAKKAQASDILRTCGILYGNLFIYLSRDFAKAEIKEIYRNLSENFSEAGGALQVASDIIFPKSPNENTTIEIRSCAINLVVDFLTEANAQLEIFFKERSKIPESELSTEPPQWIRNVKNSYERLSIHLYFSAEQINKNKRVVEKADIGIQIDEWWEIAEPMIDRLLGMPYPSFAYRLIEAIADVRWRDSTRAIHWLWRVTNASAPQGLTYEPRAADKTIEILELALADHLALPPSSRLRNEFLEILEAYLQIGWPRAFELSINSSRHLKKRGCQNKAL